MIVTTDVNPWYKWKANTILALLNAKASHSLPKSCKPVKPQHEIVTKLLWRFINLDIYKGS